MDPLPPEREYLVRTAPSVSQVKRKCKNWISSERGRFMPEFKYVRKVYNAQQMGVVGFSSSTLYIRRHEQIRFAPILVKGANHTEFSITRTVIRDKTWIFPFVELRVLCSAWRTLFSPQNYRQVLFSITLETNNRHF